MTTPVIVSLDRDRAKQADIQAAFNSLAAALLVKLEDNNLQVDSIHARHLSQPPKFGVSTRYGTAYGSSISGTAWSDGSKNWYRIAGSEIKFSNAIGSQPNMHETNMPDMQVFGPFHTNHSGVETGENSTASAITEVCLGMSTDGGTNWTPLSEITARPVGETCGDTFAFFKGAQKHYLFGTNNYHPHYPWDRGIWILGSFGGETKIAASTGTRWFCVMVDANTTNDGQFYGELYGDMRRPL